MGNNVIRFRLRLRSTDPVPRVASDLVVFPFSRRRHLVEQHARRMRALDPDQAESYITGVLENLCEELKQIGVACEDCEAAAIYEFADAIGKSLHGDHFVLKIEGGAE